MGNHGTTTFYGDELYDSDAASDGLVDQWTVYGGNTVVAGVTTPPIVLAPWVAGTIGSTELGHHVVTSYIYMVLAFRLNEGEEVVSA